MKSFFNELDTCTRDEALNLIASIIFYYSSLFSQSYHQSIEELKKII